MAKLHEYQSKEILREFGIPVPESFLVRQVTDFAGREITIGEGLVIKAQAWVTGRAGSGLIHFVHSKDEALEAIRLLLGKKVGQSTVESVLVEEQLQIEQEFYAGMIIDDRAQAPVAIFSSQGGSGVEEISKHYPQSINRTQVDVYTGLKEYQARELVRKVGIRGKLQTTLADLLVKLYQAASHYHARAAEINPIILTTDGEVFAADCRFTIDDNAVYQFPQLGIEVAREFDRPPTQLEKIAWDAEKNDYRGTFFFIQMEQDFNPGEGYIGFHGAGGGGSMMSMDAVLGQGFHIANFVDTSGNPPASKVYRAARIILAQKGIDGYFASGSGVASQEQFHSARGLVKAFLEEPLSIPAVIRLGGNAEELAVMILTRAQTEFIAPVEGYGKDDTPDYCASRLKELVSGWKPVNVTPTGFMKNQEAHESSYVFDTVTGGAISFDYRKCIDCETKACVKTCVPKILSVQGGVPVLNISPEEARRGKCIECLACEIECYFEGNRGGKICLPVAGLEG